MTFTQVAELYRSVGKTKVRNYLVDAGAAANVFAKFAYSELYVVDVGVDADLSNLKAYGLVDRKILRGTNVVKKLVRRGN